MKERILVLMSVVALMVVMVAMSVAPAFAAWDAAGGQCRTGGNLYFIQGTGDPYLLKLNRNSDQYLCYAYSNNPSSTDFRFYDNRYFITPV